MSIGGSEMNFQPWKRGPAPMKAGRTGRRSGAGMLTRGLPAVCLLVAVLTLVGCVPRYKITLTNGNMITTRGKPKFDAENNVYRFKDARGVPGYVPAFRVKEIAPL